MEKHDLTTGLTKDYAGKWCKDFFRVVIDFERRSDWAQALPEIKLALERSEREILLDYHLGLMASKGKDRVEEKKQILGTWSFVRPRLYHRVADGRRTKAMSSRRLTSPSTPLMNTISTAIYHEQDSA